MITQDEQLEFLELGRWSEESGLWLITPDQFNRLADGTMLTCINGTIVTKGIDVIDQDTRAGFIAYGVRTEQQKASLLLQLAPR